MSIKDEDIGSLLDILGIFKSSQLKKGNIDYWWQMQYKFIQSNKKIKKDEKEGLLIDLNNAREFLNKESSVDLIKNYLTNDKQKISKNVSKNNTTHRKSKLGKDSRTEKEFLFIENLSQNKQFKYTFDLNLFNKTLFVFISILFLFGNIIFGLLFLFLILWTINTYSKGFILVNSKGIYYNFLGIKKSEFHIKFSEISKCSFCPPNFMIIKFKDTNKKTLTCLLPDKKNMEIIDNINEHLYLFNQK